MEQRVGPAPSAGRKPITLGGILMTLVEPHPGHAVGYNRWYEEDHLYATLLGPGAIAGARFVARRQEKERRRVLPPADPRRGSLLAVYWLADDGSGHRAWRDARAGQLEAAGRVYKERDFVLGYDGRASFATARPQGVAPELALDHRFEHLVLSVIEPAPGLRAEEAGQRYAASLAEDLVSSDGPVEVCAGFAALAAPDPRVSRGSGRPGAEELVVVWFGDDDPVRDWGALLDRQEAAARSAGLGRVRWVSPFIPTVVGTDTYMDELT